MSRIRFAAAAASVAVAAAFGALLGGGAAGADPAPPPAPAPFFNNSSGCGALEAVLMPGTTETNPRANPSQALGEMGKLGLDLQRKKPGTNVWLTPYQAQVGPVAGQTPLKQSVDGGVARMTQQLQQRAKACPNTKFVVGGYSQGALGASKVCSAIGQGQVPGVSAKQINSCELIGNPARGAGNNSTLGTVAPGAGVLGNGLDMGELQSVTYETCLTGDPYCSFLSPSVAKGLGGGQGTQTAIAQVASIPKMQWAGSNGLPQTLADSLGSFAPLAFGNDNPHVRYSAGPNSPISQIGDRVSTGKQLPSAAPVGGLQIPGLGTGGVQPVAAAAAGLPFASPTPKTGAKTQGTGIALPAPGPSSPGLQQFDGTGAGNAVGSILGLR